MHVTTQLNITLSCYINYGISATNMEYGQCFLILSLKKTLQAIITVKKKLPHIREFYDTVYDIRRYYDNNNVFSAEVEVFDYQHMSLTSKSMY